MLADTRDDRSPAAAASPGSLSRAVAWYRARCWAGLEVRPNRIAELEAAVLILAVIVFLAGILRQPFYLGNDSAQSYAHVWWIARSIFSGEGVPLGMPVLEAGRAYAFPYGLIPWLPSALAYPLLGDRVVTASLVAGAVVLVVGIWRWLPRTRSPLFTALILLNPQFLGGLAQFQLPTFWAIAGACLAAAEFTRGRPVRGVAFATAALYAHPLTGGAALGLTYLAEVEGARELRWRHFAGLLVAGVLAAPAAWWFLHTPLMREVGMGSLLWPAVLTLKRTSIVVWAWAIDRFRVPVARWWPALALLAVLAIGNDFRNVPPSGLWDASQPRFGDFLAAGALAPEATYRVLTTTNHEDGMVEVLRAGATLGHEFFDESVNRRAWSSAEVYRCYLARKRVDRVLVAEEFERLLPWSDEPRLLRSMVEDGSARLGFAPPGDAGGTREYVLVGEAPSDCRR